MKISPPEPPDEDPDPDPDRAPDPPDDPPPSFWSGRRWLARFSFTFFVLAFWLGWTAYKGWTTHTMPEWRAALAFMAAAMSLALGFTGTRERHRHDR